MMRLTLCVFIECICSIAFALTVRNREPPINVQKLQRLIEDDPAQRVAYYNKGKWVRANDSYQWSLSCFSRLSREELCRGLLNNHNTSKVLIVGDSVSGQFHKVLTQFLNGFIMEPTETSMHCDGRVEVTFIRNDYLDTRTTYDEEPYSLQKPDMKCCSGNPHKSSDCLESAHCAPWATPEILSAYDLFILNAGAHFTNDTRMDRYHNMISTVIKLLQSELTGHQRAFWRNSVPGLGDCEKVFGDAPFSSVEEAENYISIHPWYNSEDFKLFNNESDTRFLSYGLPVLDAYTPTIQRKDRSNVSTDCLHQALLPGPLLHWVELLQNWLLPWGATC